MFCHECVMAGGREPAVGLCRFCFVALCKPHLVELFRRPPSVPQYACRHTPGVHASGGTWDDRPWKARLPD